MYDYNTDRVTFRGERHLAFRYEEDESIAELRLYPMDGLPTQPILYILPSPDFDQIDSLLFVDESYYRTRLRFKSLSTSDFTALHIRSAVAGETRTIQVPLLPYTYTKLSVELGNEELYTGEEKRFELLSNRLSNLKLDGMWRESGEVEYRLFEEGGKGFLAIIPNEDGKHSLSIVVETRKPRLDATLTPRFELNPIELEFHARGSRLAFLRIDEREIIRSPDKREGFEVQIDQNRNLELNKTYRIEDREEPGGPLIAELYTQRRLSNDKVLCLLRPYENHRTTDGFLFIKDGDEAKFITNVNISPEAKIKRIFILRDEGEWRESSVLRPGETVEIRVEGEGLRTANLYFEDLSVAELDSITRSDNAARFRIRVPVDIKRKKVEIYNRDKAMGVALKISEYERPRPLDFVKINYGDGSKVLSETPSTVLYPHVVSDVSIDFDYNKIDSEEKLYGRQWLEVEVRLSNRRDELIEMQRIPLVSVCPGAQSPRSGAYSDSKCNRQPISINSILNRKTHSLKEWSRIEIVVRHKSDRYDDEGFSERVSIIQQRLVTFDIELSLPAGLVIRRFGESNFEGLAGISLSMLAQLSFYDREAIQKEKPYKLGAGFLFINAFNLNPEVVDRDLGLVMLGSVYPTSMERKLSFPLFAGGGYFLNADQFFVLVGLGIRLSF